MMDDMVVSDQEMFDRVVRMRDEQHRAFKMRSNQNRPALKFTAVDLNAARAQLINRMIKSRGIWLFSDRTSISIGPGWFGLVGDLVAQVSTIMSQPHMQKYHFKFIQIKEKFGGLRVYYRIYSDGQEEQFPEDVQISDQQIYALVEKTSSLAYRVCEDCGKPGESRGGSWTKTLCDYHAAGP